MYVKKIISFCQVHVFKKMHTEENRFFFSASRCKLIHAKLHDTIISNVQNICLSTAS